MSERRPARVGDRLVITGADHPYVGEAVEVIENDRGLLVGRLDSGIEVYVWPRQYTSVGIDVVVPSDRAEGDR